MATLRASHAKRGAGQASDTGESECETDISSVVIPVSSVLIPDSILVSSVLIPVCSVSSLVSHRKKAQPPAAEH